MLGELIILDRNKKIIARVSPSFYFDYKYHSYLETGAESFDFSVRLDEELEQAIIEKNFVLFIRNNKIKMFQIMTCKDEESYDNVIRIVESETVGLELGNSFVRESTIEGNMNKFLTTVLQDTNYEVGYISPALDNLIATTNITEPTSVYTLLQDAISNYDCCEFEFDVKCNDSINGDYQLLVNCYANGERGNRTYKRYDYDFNTYGMSRTGDATEFCSGLIGVGANGITFKDVEWGEDENGAPLDKPKGQDFLLDPEAHAMFSNGDKYILGRYVSDATDPVDLLWETYYKLQELKEVKYSYEVPIYLTDDEFDEIEIGDTSYIVNDKFNPPIQLEARISELELSDSGNKAKFANYKTVKSGIKNLNSDALDGVLDGVKKLTQSDILALKKYLQDLDINEAEIDSIMKDILDNLDDGVVIVPDPQPGTDDDEEIVEVEDKENYKTIKITKIDGGLFLGDKRIYDIKKQGVSNIVVEKEVTTTTETSNSKVAQEYRDALDYYENFSLGTKKNNSTLSTIMSDNNKYKIGVIVRYWCKKFGLDTRLVYAMIMAESSGNPYCATSSSAGGYGLMQCERSCYFNKKQTIKFLDGTTKSFTPSYSTMNPDNGGTTTLNGVKVNKNISNQIMFGCHELRQRAEDCHYNVFATLMGYNFGMGGVYWCVTHYIKDKYGIDYYGGATYRGLSKQSTAMKNKYYAVLDTYKAPFASYRQKYKNQFGEGTVSNIEYYLRYYKPYNGSLPYFKDKNGNKIGYGAIVPSGAIEDSEPTATEIRNTIVEMAKKIVYQHTKEKIATYNQSYRTVNFDKPVRYPGTKSGIKNPICYDCSSLVSCAYLKAGLNSVYNKSCKGGTLVTSATSKSGYKMWKCDSDGIEDAIPGDLIMGTNYTVTSSNCKPSNWTGWARTHHVMVYIGKIDGVPMIAHASGYPMTWPQALRIDTLKSRSDYKNNKMFFLRPWDLAQADANTPSTEEKTTVIKKETVSEVTLKGLDGATTADYSDLVGNITINNVTDNTSFPSSVPFVFCHFGVGDLDTDSYQSLLKALANKYPKKPIFVSKEYYPNSSYTGTATTDEIDTFNAVMKNYCNQTKYIIFLDVSNGLVDDNGAILSTLSSDGYSFKDKASVQKYYDNVKKYIFNIAKGQIIDSSSVTVTLTAQSQKIHRYTKPVKSFTLKLPTTAEDDFYSRIIFITDSSSIKFVQPSTLYMSGDNCKNGAFTPAKANRYIINIFKNVDTELTTKKYYGSVTSQYTTRVVKQTGQVNCTSALNVRKGAGTSYKILGTLKNNTTVTIISKTSNNWYKIQYKDNYGYVSGKYIDNIKDVTDTTTNYTNYANFKYRDTLVKNAESFYDKRANFIYNNTCAFDFSNPSENIDSWKTDGKYHIDDNFLMQLLVMGYSYSTCKLASQTSRVEASGVSWALPYISSESKLLRYFVEQGWILDDVDYDNYSNIEPGDIIFYDADDVLNNEFMGCSHTAICVGKTDGENYIIEGHNTDGVIRKVKMSVRGSTNLLCVGRINLSK